MTTKVVDVGLQYAPATGHTTQGAYPLHAAGSLNLFSGPCQIIGFYVNNTTAGTIILADNAGAAANNISAATVAAQLVVTVNTVSATNPFSIGDLVAFGGVGGMVQLNGITGVVTAIGGASGAWTATFAGINSSGFGAFTAGGIAVDKALGGLITPAIGMQWYPAIFQNGLAVGIGGTLDLTFFYLK